MLGRALSSSRSPGQMWMLNLMHSLPSDRYTDRPFEDRNIILMCRITAMAHLGAAVLFFLDVSVSCGYSIAQQAALFHSIKSLFMNKPLTIVCDKTGLQSLEGISEEDMKLVMEIKSEATRTLAAQEGEATIDADVLLTMSILIDPTRSSCSLIDF
ncbi:NUCLEOLAR GTP-BINDING PROTEIN 1 [Salix purpurea]|uniref:NUCLEOLAR GTP-BINDING PROTEIN 1 n=1 Tax=Salix purpurea TaxID=77065 RepID=A0A9Q0PPB9_SALPP|nr:NUCLEOLAR GTP-BINDING PROTEIN 1 [Salix purpurea]